MDKSDAIKFIYQSYLKAQKFYDFNVEDSQKRNPNITKNVIRNLSTSPSIVVTGSKGKGSVCNMISQILQTTYKVGMMTSPHLIDFCERFRINNQIISDADFIKVITDIKPIISKIEETIPENVFISPIGIQTILALSFFNANKTDFNIIECGKGAKYDDANNVKHDYALINSIFLEHTRELGETIECIANDKSFVINGEQKSVFVAEQQPEVMNIIQAKADTFNVPLKIYGRDFKAINISCSKKGTTFDAIVGDNVFHDIFIPLIGEHQAKNCALALAFSLTVLKNFDFDLIKKKLCEIEWPGRMEVLSEEPFILLDACINPASCYYVKEAMKNLNIDNAIIIIGIPFDKDYLGVGKEMQSVAKSFILTKSHNPHYLFKKEQYVIMKNLGIETLWTESVDEAIAKAKSEHLNIVILGTTSLISEVKNLQMQGCL